jgi:hypothetical protein
LSAFRKDAAAKNVFVMESFEHTSPAEFGNSSRLSAGIAVLVNEFWEPPFQIQELVQEDVSRTPR